MGPAKARAAEILRALTSGDVISLKKLDKKFKKNKSSLLNAVEAGGKDVPDRLLHMAARSVQYEVCKYLIKDLGQNVNVNLAGDQGSVEIVNVLLAHGAKVNAVCNSGKVEAVVQLLIDRGIEPEATNASGFTALHVAVIKDLYAVAQSLLKNKADVDAICEKGTPLLIASETRASSAMVKLLLKHGANVNKPNISGFTPLHFAALKDSYDVAESLLENDADPDAICEEGTALHIAAGRGNENLIRLLLHHEVSVDISDKVGRKAIEVAAVGGFRDCVVMLFPSTLQIDEYEDWCIDVIMRDAKNRHHG